MRLDPVQHRRRMGAGRPGRAVAAAASRTASIRPTRPSQVAVPVRGLAHRASCSSRTTSSSTRRSRCARGCRCCARSSCSTWKACATSTTRACMSLEALRELGRDARRGAPGRSSTQRVAALPARRPGDPGLHLGHHRQAEGRDALARRPRLHRARLQHADRAGRARRAHVLPAAVPHRRAHGRRVLRDLHRLDPQLRREPRDRAGERARDRADRVHRRAARVGEVLFGRDDRAEGSRAALQQAAYAWAIGVGARRSPTACSPAQPVGRRAQAAASRSRAGWCSTTCAS